jgi:endonuclease G, mitochondrial
MDVEIKLGFDPEFLDFIVDVPEPDAAIVDDVINVNGSRQLDYMHFSLSMSESRRMARWVAWNIDGTTMKEGIGREDSRFKPDRRLKPDQQVVDDVYARNNLDRGHLARRADLLWGPRNDAIQANDDSFYFTNITPQLETFNQSSKVKGLWGKLENALLREAGKHRVSVLAGPVLGDNDAPYRGVSVPREFWKVLVYEKEGEDRARAFVVSQDPSQIRDLEDDHLAEFDVYRMSLPEIEAKTQLILPDAHHERDVHLTEIVSTLESREPVQSLEDIEW